MNIGTAISKIEDYCDPYNDEDIADAWKALVKGIAELQTDSNFLNALRVAGVDNWEGYSFACRETDKQECQGCGEEFDEDDIRRTDDDVPLCVSCLDECASEQDPDAIT